MWPATAVFIELLLNCAKRELCAYLQRRIYKWCRKNQKGSFSKQQLEYTLRKVRTPKKGSSLCAVGKVTYQ